MIRRIAEARIPPRYPEPILRDATVLSLSFSVETAIWIINIFVVSDFVKLGLSVEVMEKNKLASVSSSSQETTTDRSHSPDGSYAFLVQSQDSVSQSALLDIDNKHNGRQKRRRTRYFLPDIKENRCLFTDCFCSPEDHAILEAEYQRNSKPDKAARNDIVNRVSLGEKEVQVSENEEHSSRYIHTCTAA